MKLKLFSIGAITMSLLLFASCDGGKEFKGKTLADMNPRTSIDSLSYYFGEMQSQAYWQSIPQAKDTVIKTDNGKKEYLKGFEAGLSALEGMSETARMGYLAGLQAAMGLTSFEEQYEETMNKDFIVEGYRMGMTSDTVLKDSKIMGNANRIVQTLDAKKKEKDKKELAGKLKEYSKKGYSKLGDNVYKKLVKPGAGGKVASGMTVPVSMKYTDAKGKALQLPIPPQIDVVIGQTFPQDFVLNTAVNSMMPGEEASFVVSAADFLGGNTRQFGLNNNDLILVTLSLGDAQIAPAPKAVETTGQQPK